LRLLNLRVTHRDGGLQVLEAARIGDVEGFYREALEGCGVRGAVVIQTCNRTEIFAEVDGGERELDALQSQLLDLWLRYARQPVFHGLVRTSLDGRAVHHLLRLACGLDSMVVGEPQVTEQVADAYGFSKEHGFASPTLSRIFESSLRAARSIRARAGLEEENRNLGELAVRYALNRLSGAMARVLVIGTGKAGRLILEALKRVGVKEVYLAGRSPEHTGQVAARFGAQPVPLESCLEAVGQVDAIFVATTSSVSAITPEKLSQPRWRGRRLLILDLSVPRTVQRHHTGEAQPAAVAGPAAPHPGPIGPTHRRPQGWGSWARCARHPGGPEVSGGPGWRGAGGAGLGGRGAGGRGGS